MKIIILVIFGFSSMYAMNWNNSSETPKMLVAINNGDVQHVKIKIDEICTKPYGSIQALYNNTNQQNIDKNALWKLAKAKEQETEFDTKTHCNLSVYKNMMIGLACLGSAALVTGFFIVIPATTGNFNALQNGGAAGSAASLLAALGIKHLHCTINNSDAINFYAKQLAIKGLVKKLFPREQEPV